MKFDLMLILVLLIFSSVGLVYLNYGRKLGELRYVLTGIMLLLYGYFTPSLAWAVGLGVLLAVLPYVRLFW